ncbi:hypothetical protein [Clostridium sp.]|uniref:hypothetical protein n=1 Tax=Clostridium sp. TaxID=1506 RepID=UPI0026DD021D|nr:hypothetical protein [Clostridium sp.]MDO5040359.1 hypothetical protein [Clostridium sp.]
MKKFLCSVIIGMISMTMIIPTVIADAESKYNINTISELHEVIEKENKDGINDSEREIIIKKTSPEVLNAYFDNIEKEAKQKINSIGEQKMTIDLNTKGEVIKNIVKIPIEGGEVILENNMIPIEKNSREYLSYGDYKLQSKYRIKHTLYPDTYLVLNTFYNVKSDGLRATSTSTGGTSAVWPNKVSGSSRVTDSRAEKISYDINGQGDYKYTLEVLGNQIVQRDSTIISYVKWVGKSGNKLDVSYWSNIS